jgi:hypothetical protein
MALMPRRFKVMCGRLQRIYRFALYARHFVGPSVFCSELQGLRRPRGIRPLEAKYYWNVRGTVSEGPRRADGHYFPQARLALLLRE